MRYVHYMRSIQKRSTSQITSIIPEGLQVMGMILHFQFFFVNMLLYRTSFRNNIIARLHLQSRAEIIPRILKQTLTLELST